jgi:hypothetical protein
VCRLPQAVLRIVGFLLAHLVASLGEVHPLYCWSDVFGIACLDGRRPLWRTAVFPRLTLREAVTLGHIVASTAGCDDVSGPIRPGLTGVRR